jgi:hypothetical protein
MNAPTSALAIALLVALLVIDRLTRAGRPGGRSKDDSGGRQGLLNRRGPGFPGPSEAHMNTAISALATRHSNTPADGTQTQPQPAAPLTIAAVTRARSSSPITYGGIV